MNCLGNLFFICLGVLAGYCMTIGMVIIEITDFKGKVRFKRKERNMPTLYDDVNARCPFFRYSEYRKISCEGITDGCSTNIEFDCKANRDLHRRVFCDAKYQNCEIYTMLEAKYEDE